MLLPKPQNFHQLNSKSTNSFREPATRYWLLSQNFLQLTRNIFNRQEGNGMHVQFAHMKHMVTYYDTQQVP